MSYTIARYPVHLIDVLLLGDGTRITIRPSLPQDLEVQRAFFRGLSPEGRHARFLTRISDLPEGLAQRFAAIDYRNHLALLAEVFEDGRETMIGEARYVLDGSEPRTGEFAIAVADAWRRKGIGLVLLDRIEQEAAGSGVRRLVADTLLTNEAMIRLARRAGYAVKTHRIDGTLARLEKDLGSSQVLPPVAA